MGADGALRLIELRDRDGDGRIDEPTIDAVEQPFRHAVIRRKLSFGTQSASGSHFVERMPTMM